MLECCRKPWRDYRRTVWQCNNKFKGGERYLTPTVDTETVQRLFIKAYIQMMENRERIIEDCELMRKKLTDFKSMDADIERQLEETQVVAELVKAAVKENATTTQSQKAYLEKYEALTKRYETAAAELERLQNLRTIRSQKDKEMALYIRTLKKTADRIDRMERHLMDCDGRESNRPQERRDNLCVLQWY